MAMVKVVMCACFGFAAMTLQGCGGDSGTTPAPGPATTPAPGPAAITTSPYKFPKITDGTLTLTWAAAGTDKLKVTLASTYTGSLTPAWLAVGFSPDGSMDNGNYVMGYTDCVRSMSNVAKGSVPANSTKSLPITGASFAMIGAAMTLEFEVSTGPWMLAGGNYVLTAAGSTAVKPKDCTTALTKDNAHDMHAFVNGGSKFVLKAAQHLEVV